MKIKGSCLCEAVQYQLEEEPFECCFCHCSICRKIAGSTGGAYGSVSRNKFSWVTEEKLVSKFNPTDTTTRFFCSACGSFLLTEHAAEPKNVFVSLGCLDSEIDSKPSYHQFTSDLPKWVIIDDNLPRYSGWPNE